MSGDNSALSGLEAETHRLVSMSISKMEVAIAEWDASKRKPEGLSQQMKDIRRFHRILSEWERDSLKGARDVKGAARRLRRFSEICRDIEKSGLIS